MGAGGRCCRQQDSPDQDQVDHLGEDVGDDVADDNVEDADFKLIILLMLLLMVMMMMIIWRAYKVEEEDMLGLR